MQRKVCKKCGRELPIGNFPRCSRLKSGRASYCKKCYRELSKAYYVANREKCKARSKRNYIKKCNERREEIRREKIEKNGGVIGGWKMYYLTHVKHGERRYNAVSMGGEVFKTDNKREFMRFLEEAI